ncbi:RING-H2 finger protein ATL2-like [Cornus florida]|uniref:RING-H2 finger protein ATL2-like n=1 Tax=Cornus florida TaxID=4283 RepID=UPI00289F8B53|nr:RING-H2 finger protein ATL2-like [Cornus florida]
MDDDNYGRRYGPKGYAQSGKIMLSAIVILFGVVVFMVCLHIYFRWYLRRSRRRHLQVRRRNRRLVFYLESRNPNSASATTVHGLDSSVLISLPIFFSPETHPDSLECAVCLSEFEENETGRLLPKCKHSFHTDCIDMWFHSHSTCPVCRSPVEPQNSPPVHENPPDSAVPVAEPVEPGPDSCSGLPMDSSSSSSLGTRRKGLDMETVTVEVQRRNESVDELVLSSPASQALRSPGTRLLSLKRILSMNRKSPSGVGASCGTCGVGVSELDVDESTQKTRAHTPR